MACLGTRLSRGCKWVVYLYIRCKLRCLVCSTCVSVNKKSACVQVFAPSFFVFSMPEYPCQYFPPMNYTITMFAHHLSHSAPQHSCDDEKLVVSQFTWSWVKYRTILLQEMHTVMFPAYLFDWENVFVIDYEIPGTPSTLEVLILLG